MRRKVLLVCVFVLAPLSIGAQSSGNAPPQGTVGTATLKTDFIDGIRSGNTGKFLSYVAAGGLNVGSEPRHESRSEVEQQLAHRKGLYCKLFDSSCIQTEIKLDASARACSYREALEHSKNPRIAATETVRNGVRQAILAAQVNAEQCPDLKLIDFIFNYQGDGWKLFSVP
jgi:hypothetical protein